MKRTFRHAAIIAGLIERRHPGQEKSARQMSASSDLIFDVLMRHDPGHVLLEAASRDAASGLLDIARLGRFLQRIQGRIEHRALSHVSPLAVPILLAIGREPVHSDTTDSILLDAAAALIAEATNV